jgi:fluoride exporter
VSGPWTDPLGAPVHPLLLAGAMAVAGALGAVLRVVVTRKLEEWRRPTGGRIPLGTLSVNLAGAFLAGLLAGTLEAGSPLVLVAGVGFLGAFTTFSTWMLELRVRLEAPGSRPGGLLYLALSVGPGVGLALAGLALGAIIVSSGLTGV